MRGVTYKRQTYATELAARWAAFFDAMEIEHAHIVSWNVNDRNASGLEMLYLPQSDFYALVNANTDPAPGAWPEDAVVDAVQLIAKRKSPMLTLGAIPECHTDRLLYAKLLRWDAWRDALVAETYPMQGDGEGGLVWTRGYSMCKNYGIYRGGMRNRERVGRWLKAVDREHRLFELEPEIEDDPVGLYYSDSLTREENTKLESAYAYARDVQFGRVMTHA